MDRGVNLRRFSFTCPHYWWPRRKDGEADRDAALDEANAENDNESSVGYMTTQFDGFQSRRHEAPKRIHILGAGNLGAFVAHSLAGIPNRPPITLLLHRRQLRIWEDHDCSIEVTTHGMKETRRGFEAEAVRRFLEYSSIPVENQSGKGVGSSNMTRGGEREGILPRDLTSKTGDSSGDDMPTLKESNPVADDNVHSDILGDRVTSEESASDADDLLTPETDIKAWFAQAEPDLDEAQSKNNDITAPDPVHALDKQEEIIHHLIVSVKAPQTVKAIKAIAHRLTQDSSILFLQNGMGTVDEVNEKVFPNEKYRPTYIAGVVSHGLYSKRPFSVVHAGEGTIALGVLPRMPVGESLQPETLNQLSSSARYIMRTMTRTAVFVAVGFSPTDILQQQLDKLAVNCIINPLTAILDCKNGALMYNFYFQRVVRLLLAEISLVIKSLPELRNVPNVNMRFHTLRLERMVFSIANTTAENYSSMLQDIRSGRLSEIDYINGYIVKRGEEMGVHCVMNYMLMHMVKGKNKNTFQETADLLPLAGQRS